MILTRCPACGTTFRVRPEQLRAREGRVRCGQCNHAFNALEASVEESPLADEAAEASPAPAAAAGTPLFVLEEKPQAAPDAESPAAAEQADAEEAGAEAPAGSGQDSDTADKAPPPLPASTEAIEPVFDASPVAAPAAPAALADQRIEPVGDIGAEAVDEWPAADIAPFDDEAPAEFGHPFPDADHEEARPDAPAFAFKPDWPDASELDLRAPAAADEASDEPLDFDSLLHKQDTGDSAPAPLSDEPDAQPWPASEEPAAQVIEPFKPLDAEARIDAEDNDEAATEEALPAPADDEDTPAPALRQAAWAAGATLLSLALLAQGVLVFRSDIAQSSPQMRPFMESLCAGLGCDLPLPRESAEIAIESSDIQPDASREAFFTLHATLRNRAEFQQAYPHLEITLTDARDKALVRKVLEPVQWLPADAPRDAFPAHREVATRVSFEAPGVAAAGYRVYVFYP